MSAVYGIRYTCDRCSTTVEVWRPDGNTPAIRLDIPPGWARSRYAQTGVKPLWQRPLACPACAPALTAHEDAFAEWQRRQSEAIREAYAPAQAAVAEWLGAHPRPPLTLSWAPR